MDVRSEGKYLEALKKIGRLADERLDRQTADRVMGLIATELTRLGVTIDRHNNRENTSLREKL